MAPALYVAAAWAYALVLFVLIHAAATDPAVPTYFWISRAFLWIAWIVLPLVLYFRVARASLLLYTFNFGMTLLTAFVIESTLPLSRLEDPYLEGVARAYSKVYGYILLCALQVAASVILVVGPPDLAARLARHFGPRFFVTVCLLYAFILGGIVVSVPLRIRDTEFREYVRWPDNVTGVINTHYQSSHQKPVEYVRWTSAFIRVTLFIDYFVVGLAAACYAVIAKPFKVTFIALQIAFFTVYLFSLLIISIERWLYPYYVPAHHTCIHGGPCTFHMNGYSTPDLATMLVILTLVFMFIMYLCSLLMLRPYWPALEKEWGWMCPPRRRRKFEGSDEEQQW